jgi:hypothetical protein
VFCPLNISQRIPVLDAPTDVARGLRSNLNYSRHCSMGQCNEPSLDSLSFQFLFCFVRHASLKLNLLFLAAGDDQKMCLILLSMRSTKVKR